MSHVLLDISDNIMTITLSRFKQKNALSIQMYADLVDALNSYETDESLLVCVIQGDNSCFCAGNDLKDFLNSGELNDEHPTVQFINRIATCNKPIVAAVAGPAVGIGATMLLHFDYVVAADNSRFQLPFAKLGLCPEAASSNILPKMAGRRVAFELLVLGESFDGDKAQSIGIVNAVCAPEQLLPQARAKALAIASLPREAVLKSKSLIQAAEIKNVQEVIKLELDYFQQLLKTDESQARIGQFFQ